MKILFWFMIGLFILGCLVFLSSCVGVIWVDHYQYGGTSLTPQYEFIVKMAKTSAIFIAFSGISIFPICAGIDDDKERAGDV